MTGTASRKPVGLAVRRTSTKKQSWWLIEVGPRRRRAAIPARGPREPLLQRIENGQIDPTRIITHTLPLDEAERGFEMFKNKQDNCEKVVLKP
jgi:threonine dehydrogenase-like Zn-dependent dehydrogenase